MSLTLGGCGGLEKRDFGQSVCFGKMLWSWKYSAGQFLILMQVVVFKRQMLDYLLFGLYSGLERTEFGQFYFGGSL